MNQVHVLRVVVASPKEVRRERNALVEVAEELNRGIADARALRLEISRWELDAFPGFHVEGPQGIIDLVLNIEDCDLFIGIFWTRFGTPTLDAKSGTEHEFRKAYEAWKRSQRPQIMFYFNQQKPNMPNTREEIEQLAQVVDFKNTFPKEGLWWSYDGKDEFRKLVRNHLTQFIRTISVSDGTSNNSNTIPIEMKDEQASLAAQELENRGVVSNDRDEEQFDGTNELTESLQLEENMLNMSALTVQQVNDAWEKVVKRTRQKTPSGTIAAMLRLYKILDVEGTAEQPIVVIQSEKQAHYKYVKDEDRYKILEWALEMEFNRPCQVRLVPPNAIPQTQNPSEF